MTATSTNSEEATAMPAVPLGSVVEEEGPQLTSAQTDMVLAAMEAAGLEIGAELEVSANDAEVAAVCGLSPTAELPISLAPDYWSPQRLGLLHLDMWAYMSRKEYELEDPAVERYGAAELPETARMRRYLRLRPRREDMPILSGWNDDKQQTKL